MARKTDAHTPEQRERGRAERRRLWGPTSKLVLDDIHDAPADPPAYLEEQRGRYIRILEGIADQTDDAKLKAAIIHDLIRISSLGKRSDGIAELLRRDLPDLSHLSVDDLERIVEANKTNGNTRL